MLRRRFLALLMGLALLSLAGDCNLAVRDNWEVLNNTDGPLTILIDEPDIEDRQVIVESRVGRDVPPHSGDNCLDASSVVVDADGEIVFRLDRGPCAGDRWVFNADGSVEVN